MTAIEIVPFFPEKPLVGKANFESERILSPLSKKWKDQNIKIELSLLRKLPYLLKKEKEFYAILLKKENSLVLIEVWEKPPKPKEILGCAIDLGSTTIAFYIYDFYSKRLLQKFSISNPQIEIGEDILTRLHFAKREKNLRYLKEITLLALNQELEKIGPEKIFFVSICGNTAMTHFLLELPVNYLFVEPYIAVAKWFHPFKGSEVGLKIHPLGRVFIFPLAGTYFGGDLIAGLYATDFHQKEELSFYIDIGTNAEVVLGNREFLLACAGAAGPALEGGIFEWGVRADKGAIENFSFDPQTLKFRYKTIGGEKPIGFCGSAVIQLIAELFIHKFISPQGKFNKDIASPFLREKEGEILLELVPSEETAHKKPIYIQEGEIKSFIRSKGAMYTILTLLCEKVGLSLEEIQNFYIAGSFGNKIDVKSAVLLGMLPESASEKTVGVGNAAGEGALKFLLAPNYQEIKKIADQITYLELNREGRFMELLTGALLIPHVNLELFPKVKKWLKRD